MFRAVVWRGAGYRQNTARSAGAVSWRGAAGARGYSWRSGIVLARYSWRANENKLFTDSPPPAHRLLLRTDSATSIVF